MASANNGAVKDKSASTAHPGESSGVLLVARITSICADRGQPREYFDPEDLQTKAESMKEDGQDKPVDVIDIKATVEAFENWRKEDGPCPVNLATLRANAEEFQYKIVDGGQRYLAAQIAQIPLLEVRVVAPMTRKNTYRRQIRANHVTPLGILEMAHSLRRGVVEFGMTHAQLARDSKCSVSKISHYLSINKLHSVIQKRLHPSTPQDQQLSLMSAVALAQVEDQNQQMIFFGRITKGDKISMTTDEIRMMVDDWLEKYGGGKKRLGRPLSKPKDVRYHLQGLSTSLPSQLYVTKEAMTMKQPAFDALFNALSAYEIEQMMVGFQRAIDYEGEIIQALSHTYEAKGGKLRDLVEKVSVLAQVRPRACR